MSNGRMEVCLVGAGPRGLSVLERLCAHERKSPRWERLIVHVVEPGQPGAGRVWQPSQSWHLLMNTVASQVTVYTDASVAVQGPVEEGPSLYQWAKALGPSALTAGAGQAYDEVTLAEARGLGPDTYPTRALYGHYLTWVFRQVTSNAPAHITVRVHPSRAVALHGAGPGGAGEAQSVVLEDGTRLAGLGAVVLAQGHVAVRPTGTERDFAAHAARYGLTYIAPANPAEVDLSAVAPGETVLLRGLGLNFFDYMSLFTQARGGVFERVEGRLVYRRSGREPQLWAGSRRGVPYQARGENEKGAHGRYHPRLLTVARVAAMRERVRGGAPLRFRDELWPLVSKEVRTVYYEALLSGRLPQGRVAEFADAFLRAEAGGAEERLLGAAGVAPEERWDWDLVARPHAARSFRDLASFRAWLRAHLDEDVRHARQGNVSGPFKAALDVLRDLRNELRLAVDHGGLTADSHRDELERWYTPLNAYLSIGPPASRVEEMAALMDAGVLEVTGPGMRVATAAGAAGACFTAGSAQFPDLRVRARVLIEARLPEIDVRRTADPLMRQLLSSGQARPYRVQDYETGGLDVSERPYHLLDARGVPHPRRFAYGVPTEAVHWVTAAGIRPGVGSVTLEDSDAIAAALLGLRALPAPRADSSPRADSAPRAAAHTESGAPV